MYLVPFSLSSYTIVFADVCDELFLIRKTLCGWLVFFVEVFSAVKASISTGCLFLSTSYKMILWRDLKTSGWYSSRGQTTRPPMFASDPLSTLKSGSVMMMVSLSLSLSLSRLGEVSSIALTITSKTYCLPVLPRKST